MGNATPVADLLVLAPSGATFAVDVKGQSTKNFWRIKAKAPTANLFYVLCYVELDPTKTRFFVLSQPTLAGLMDAYEHSGVKFDPRFSGFNWATAHQFENRWDGLPQ